MESVNVASLSKACFCTEDYFILKNGYSPSYSPSQENFRKYVGDHSQPLHKKLTKSDVNVNLNRLLLIKEEAEEHFLPLVEDHEDIEAGVDVNAYDKYGNIYPLKFKKWANKYYILNGAWKSFFQDYKLQNDDTVTTWMFRHSNDNKLCVALEFEKN